MKNKLVLSFMLFSISVSAQSQVNWASTIDIAASASGNNHPRIALNATGYPLVIWGHSSRAMFSRWNGMTFTAPVILHPSNMSIAESSWMGPDIASHGDTVYVIMKATPEADTSSHIYLVHSYDGGFTFSLPVQVDQIGDSISRFPTVTTDSTGNPIIGFMKFNSSFGDARWVVTKSSDYGITFSADVKTSGWSAAGSTVCDCCPGSIVAEANLVAMLYRDNNNNIRDTWAGISSDAGNSFYAGINLDQNNWYLNSCPATGPDGVITGDSLYTVFMNGAGGINRVYRNTASLSSGSAPVSQLITGTIPGMTQQNYPRMAQLGNAIAIVWKQTVNNSDQLPLLFSNNIFNGFPAVYDTVDLNYITNTDVALSGNTVFIVWQDDNSGTVKFRYGTYSATNVGETISAFIPVSIFPNPVSDENLEMHITISKPDHFTLIITDMFGKEYMKTGKQSSDSLNKINVSSLPAGMFLLRLTGTDQTTTAKFIKQ